MAELPSARGRLFSDIDFMVPRARIEEVEHRLLDAGWEPAVADEYDQLYYRRWTHQIPPLRHFRRNTVLDVHHTIVPLTARAPVAAEALATQSLALDGDGQRSEEHTSELQSLMRTSYAVLCLKKKTSNPIIKLTPAQ